MDKIDNLDDEPGWVVESKFAPTRSNIELVDRPRLVARLEDARKARIVLLVAPAGFGKSSLLAQWFEGKAESRDLYAWLSVDDGESDPKQFLSYVILALAEGGLDLGHMEVAARNGLPDSRIEPVLNKLINCIAAQERDCVLIIDDLHRADSSQAVELIAKLVRLAPPNFTLVVNSRSAPKLDIPVLMASGDAVEIGPEQLRLTQAEAISALGDAISVEDAKTIFSQTEGWPVAVQLARVQKHAKPTVPIREDVSMGLIASYLTDQVLETLEPDLREFLLEVSVLEEFNAELANFIRNASDSASLLRRLEPLQALLVPTNSEAGWVRLHHLFAEYLFASFQQQHPEEVARIQTAASQWFDRNGQLIPAVKYAGLAGNDDEIERLILDAGGWSIILRQGIGVMRTLLRLAPDHLASGNARLMLARAYLCCKDGEYQEARGLFDAAEALKNGSDIEAYDKDRRLVGSMVFAYEDSREWTQEVGSENIAAQIDDWSPLEAGTLLCESVIAHFSLGGFDRLKTDLELAFGQMRKSGSVLGLNYCYLHAGIHALYSANFDLARANMAQASELAENNFGSDSGLLHLSKALTYAMHSWSGESGDDEIEEFSRTLAHLEDNDAWAEAFLVGLDSAFNLCEQKSEYALAVELCDRMNAVAAHRKLARLERLCLILRMKAAYLRGHTNEATRLTEELVRWVKVRDLGDGSRDWQNHYLAVAALATTRMVPTSFAQNALRKCIEDSKTRGLKLFEIRLMVAYSILMWQLSDQRQSVDLLTQALNLAAPQRIMGPFLADDRLDRMLSSVKADLNLHQESLILVNFVAGILKTRKKLRPSSGSELLSVREREIVEQLAEGRSNKEIARRFELTENTVKFHLKNIFGKLSVQRRTQAVAVARQLGIVT